MHKTSSLLAPLVALLLVGCAGSARMSGSASISAPALVYVSPGVQVVENYREPIFYSDNYYWRYSGNVWYRSSVHTSGWVRYQAPSAVLRIERPSAYVYYRGSARASTGPQSTPATRQQHKDMKEAQKEERKEQQEERKEQQEERKEQRKEQQEERKEQQEERKEQQKEQRNDAKKGRK